MLILSRRPGDSVIIDGGIKLVVIACERGGVRIGIEAPPDVGILRGEIVTQIADENRRAGEADGARAWMAAVGVKAPAEPGPASPSADVAARIPAA